MTWPEPNARALEIAARAEQIASDAREQCRREYEGLREETSKRFDKLAADIAGIHRTIYIAIGMGMAASAMLGMLLPHLLPKLVAQ